MFCYLSKQNKRFFKKLSYLRPLVSGSTMFDHYKDVCLLFAAELSHVLKDYFDEDTFFDQKKIIMEELIFNKLPFRVCNHLFSCSRSYYCYVVCLFCTRFNVKQKNASDYINKKLFVPIDFFPPSITEGVLLMHKVYFLFITTERYLLINFKILASFIVNASIDHLFCIKHV